MPPPAPSKATRQQAEKAGRQAENLTALYLQLKGYRILQRRFKTRAGEIDLIVRKAGTLAFIEVKRRQSLKLAQDSLNSQTQSRIMKAADIYISQNSHAQKLAHRFDAVFIISSGISSGLKGLGRPYHMKDLWRPK